MIKLLWRLLWGWPTPPVKCAKECDWQVVDSIKLYRQYDDPETDLPIGRHYIKECKACGEMKDYRF